MKIILASNRLPLKVVRNGGDIILEDSIGGLATAFNNYKNSNSTDFVWVGWSGIDDDVDSKEITKKLQKENNLYPIFLSKSEIKGYYQGFCNQVLWPLFHYFPSYIRFNEKYWELYKKSNYKFAEAIVKIYEEGDLILVQDYHMMLIPMIIRQKIPDAKIGFFLHIPFPAYEVYRVLPFEWRIGLTKGLLGADLVAFHTQEYKSYFEDAADHLVDIKRQNDFLLYSNRKIITKTLPLGINYEDFNTQVNDDEVNIDLADLKKSLKGKKMILSVDRLDYTKGITDRLKAFAYFLKKNPEYIKKVTLVLIAAPSRESISRYKFMNKQINQTVGKINGEFGELDWTPVIYQNKTYTQEQLKLLYKLADVALITPLRDGMNLTAKEYVASKEDKKGVLILSELAGAAKELKEALIVNPNSYKEVSDALIKALQMNEDEQTIRIDKMQKRLKNNDVTKWFLQIINAFKSEV